MKELILKLREQGYTYNQIRDELGCSKSTISYHLGEGQKEKNLIRKQNRRRVISPVYRKLENYKSRKGLVNKVHHFNTRDARDVSCIENFSADDVMSQIGENPKCYLTGEPIDLNNPNSYSFDHKVPVAKGGDNSLGNLGLASKNANQMKHDMLYDDFVELCVKVVRHSGRYQLYPAETDVEVSS